MAVIPLLGWIVSRTRKIKLEINTKSIGILPSRTVLPGLHKKY